LILFGATARQVTYSANIEIDHRALEVFEVLELDQQAFAKIARRHSDRIEKLNAPQHGFDFFRLSFRRTTNVFPAKHEITIFVEILNDMQPDSRLALGDF